LGGKKQTHLRKKRDVEKAEELWWKSLRFVRGGV